MGFVNQLVDKQSHLLGETFIFCLESYIYEVCVLMHNMSDKVTNVDLAKFQGKLSWWFLGSSHIINQCTSVHWKALAYDQQYMSTDAVVEECSLHE